VIGGFSFTHVIAESNSSTGGGDNRSTAVVASTSDTSDLAGGGGSNSSVLLSSDNTGTSTGNQVKDVDTTPTVNVNNMSTYPQTGDSSDIGLIITGFTILIGLFAFYSYKLRKSLKFLQVSK